MQPIRARARAAMKALGASEVLWRLTSDDPEVDLYLEGQWRPDDGVAEQAPATFSATVSPGTAAPTVQWIAAGARVLEARISFVAPDFQKDVGAELATLRRLEAVDPALGRAPRVIFEWGELHTIRGFATVKIRTTSYWRATGRPREVMADLSITQAAPIDVEETGATGETLYRVLGEGETFELAAASIYANPLKGELLRRVNPDLATRREQAGDLIKILEPDHPSMKGRPRPLAFCYQGDHEQQIRELSEALAQRRLSVRSWDSLPEVVSGEIEL